jgi:hypothetical protein
MLCNLCWKMQVILYRNTYIEREYTILEGLFVLWDCSVFLLGWYLVWKFTVLLHYAKIHWFVTVHGYIWNYIWQYITFLMMSLLCIYWTTDPLCKTELSSQLLYHFLFLFTKRALLLLFYSHIITTEHATTTATSKDRPQVCRLGRTDNGLHVYMHKRSKQLPSTYIWLHPQHVEN